MKTNLTSKTKAILTSILFLLPLIVMASNFIHDVSAGTMKVIELKNIALDFGVYSFAGAIIGATNHIIARTFNVKLWFKDTYKPALIAYVAGMALITTDLYIPSINFLIEGVIGQEIDTMNYSRLTLAAIALVAIIKGFFKIKSTQAKVAKAK